MNFDPHVIAKARTFMRDPSVDFQAREMAAEILRATGEAPELPDGQFLPVTQTINLISDKPTDDHKALVIRLELDYPEYAALEDLHQTAYEALKHRQTELRQLLNKINNGDAELPGPLNKRDLERAIAEADNDVRRALRLIEKVKRPPPRGA